MKPKNKPKQYLNSQQQLDKLVNEKNVVLDKPKNEAINFLERYNYIKIFPPFKDLLVDYNFDNSKPIKSKNKRILREYQQGLRVPINVKAPININTLTKHLKDSKTGKHQYTKSTEFSELQDLRENNKKISAKIFEEFQDLEPAMKTVLSDFIGNHSSSKNIPWFEWILSIKTHDKQFETINTLNRIYDDTTKTFPKSTAYERYKFMNPNIWYIIDDMNLGAIKELIVLIMYSELDDDIIRLFCIKLFYDILGRDFDLEDFKYKDFKYKLIKLVKLRNITMHFNSLPSYLLQERVKRLQIESKDKNLRFWFVINTFENKSIGNFIKSYISSGVRNIHKISEDFIFNDCKIGFHIEMEDIKTGITNSLDLKILNIIDWWFK